MRNAAVKSAVQKVRKSNWNNKGFLPVKHVVMENAGLNLDITTYVRDEHVSDHQSYSNNATDNVTVPLV